MYLSKLFLPTSKEAPADARIASYALMTRGGFVKKMSSGVYAYLPLGVRLMRKVENIVREEMDAIGSQECIMPILVSRELLTPSNRWDVYKELLFRLKDRHNVDYALGPTHEEAFTVTVKDAVQSYKDFPVSIYQIHSKFRDEIRPRFGIMRGREFVMKDAYTFNLTEECLDKSYKDMSGAYSRSFKRMGLDTVAVKADSGAIGGDNSEEFMVLSHIGEETIIFCDKCGYRANVEKGNVARDPKVENKTTEPYKEVHTPNIITIEDLEKFFDNKMTARDFVKTLLFTLDTGETIAVLIRGDLDVNEIKLGNFLGGVDVALATPETILEVTGAKVGFAGPIGLKKKIRVLADYSLESMDKMGVGGNKVDTHITSVNMERDFKVDAWGDFRTARDGDACPHCNNKMYAKKGLELGHVFKLGKKYSSAFNLSVLDENNKPVTLFMGCYGIGIDRAAAAVIEQHNDDKGIIFPISVAPYEAIVVAVEKSGPSFDAAKKIYEELCKAGVETLFDDTDERYGVKLGTADLIGIPIRIVIGKKEFESGEAEFKLRRDKEGSKIKLDSVVKHTVDTKAKLFKEINDKV